jgi:hypothetical protein
MNFIQKLLLFEALTFGAATLVHHGIIFPGYEHFQAATAESVIGLVLFVAFLLTFAMRTAQKKVGMLAQGFALLGTLVGAVMIAIGVGPQTTGDLIYHAFLLVLLLSGLVKMSKKMT